MMIAKNRFDHTFNQYNSAGIRNLTLLKYVNDTLTETTNGSVYIEEDIHDEEPVENQDDNETEIARYDLFDRSGVASITELFERKLVGTGSV